MLFFDSVHDKSLKMRVHNSIDLSIEAFWIEELRAPYSKSILKATDWKLQADWESSEIIIMMKRRIFRHLTKTEKRELSFFSLIHVKTWLN